MYNANTVLMADRCNKATAGKPEGGTEEFFTVATTHIVLRPKLPQESVEMKGAGVPHFYGEQVYDIESKEPTLKIHNDIMLPSTRLQSIPSRFIKYMTYLGSIEAGFQCDGIYKLGRAVLEASMDSASTGRYQRISIRAPGVKSAKTIYDQFRQGSLEPFKKWSEKPFEISQIP